ncbi:hypothetical protein AMELA_G00244070 [Ameiurus melas]|uniref:Ig-like domain-containing protein n=1 Tax=Ameiurus melas TaxID=219545 RepID=A0A7J5ZSE0_AMEME|nr:hypothetical protein AMELA_G00244070 [Ameiurus melas]
MAVCVFSSLLTVLCVGLYGKRTYAETCTDLILSPPSLLVEYGSSAEVNCSIPNKPVTPYILGWESKTSQPRTNTETSVMWKVDRLTMWEEAEGLRCYFTVGMTQCESYVNLTIYKRPDRVTLSSVSDVVVEGNQTELSREDDGVQYQCAAVLNLDQHPHVFTSQPITITVHYKPVIAEPLDTTVILAEGEIQGLNCSAHGNPSPHYHWTSPDKRTVSNSSSIVISTGRRQDQGQYTCTASNYLGQATRKVTVTETCPDPILSPPSLLVEYGSSAEVNCSIPNKPETPYILGWKSKMSPVITFNETSVMWKVDRLTSWEEAEGLRCYFTVGNTQCESYVNLTIYKRPDRVTLSSVSDVVVEGNHTELRCEIENVGPGGKLSVRWSRADPKQNNTFTHFTDTSFPDLVNELMSVNKTVNLTVTPSREDDGVQYQCAAVLNLDQHPRVFTSQPITITVHCKPIIAEPLDTTVILAEGEMLVMNCSAHGNPSPH